MMLLAFVSVCLKHMSVNLILMFVCSLLKSVCSLLLQQLHSLLRLLAPRGLLPAPPVFVQFFQLSNFGDKCHINFQIYINFFKPNAVTLFYKRDLAGPCRLLHAASTFLPPCGNHMHRCSLLLHRSHAKICLPAPYPTLLFHHGR